MPPPTISNGLDLTADLDGMLMDGRRHGVAGNNGDAAIRANVALKKCPGAKAHMFWPPGLSPQSREWVTTNINEGDVCRKRRRISTSPSGDLAKPVLPKEDVDATIDARRR